MSRFYTGTAERKVDGCFRIRIPHKFIQDDGREYFIFYDPAKNAVMLYPYDSGDIADLVRADDLGENSRLSAAVAEGRKIKLDGYKKILLPKNMRGFLDNDKTVCIVGVFDHLEIYSKAQFEKKNSRADASAMFGRWNK